MRNRKAVIFGFSFFVILTLSGQGLLNDKVFVGGGIGSDGIILSTANIRVSLNGHVGYKITERFSAGLRARYVYDDYRLQEVVLNHIGGGIFSRYIITQNIFAAAEYERMTYQVAINNDINNTDRIGFNSLFVGGGYFQPLGGVLTFSLTGYYNLLYGDGTNSQYSSPFLIRAGFNYGF
jgi:hypothetical protein